MSSKLPSSLKWLVDKRARLIGDIQSHENELKTFKEEVDGRIRKIQADIAAVDRMFEMHAIRISPEIIRPIRSHTKVKTLPYGKMTKHILTVLKKVNGRILTTKEITFHVIEMAGLEVDEAGFSSLRYGIRKNLQHLSNQRFVRRHHKKRTAMEGRWSLPSLKHEPEMEMRLARKL